VFVHLCRVGGAEYVALGTASLFYMLILLLFCRVQHRSVTESMQIRFENADLIAELQVQKAHAEAAKARAEQADLAKSRFLAAASHDLRQPLHALSLFSATLRELELDTRQRSVVEQIYRNIDSLEALFDELLDISQTGRRLHPPEHRGFSYPTRAGRAANALRAASRRKGALVSRPHLTRDRQVRRRTAGARAWQFGRQCHPLHTHEGGVLVGCRRRGETPHHCRLDSGIGIPAPERERIFEEFFQLGNPERDRRNGLGLGLPIARRIAHPAGQRARIAIDAGARLGVRAERSARGHRARRARSAGGSRSRATPWRAAA